ncbi:MAG: SCO family protein [Pseudomonadales bacterium]|jgi:protein SCO1/2
MPSEAQQQGIHRTLIWIFAFIAMVLGLVFSTYMHRDRTLSVEEAASLGYIQFERPREVKGLQMMNQDGGVVDESAFKGRWTWVYFGFTYCPDICPTTLAMLAKALEGLDEPPDVVLVSVDPERDSPEQLKRYLSAFSPSFKGMVGSHAQTVTFATQVNVAFGKIPGSEPGTYTMDHTGSIVVMNPAGEYAGFIKAPHNVQGLATLASRL